MQHYKELFHLEKHVEGGYYRSFFRSDHEVIPCNERYQHTKRMAGSSIYYLLEKNDYSRWHRMRSDEIWHYYDGESIVDIFVIESVDTIHLYQLGNPRIQPDTSFQVAVKGGHWFAAKLRDQTSFALMGCTVFPGFEEEDFKLGDENELMKCYPLLASQIQQFL